MMKRPRLTRTMFHVLVSMRSTGLTYVWEIAERTGLPPGRVSDVLASMPHKVVSLISWRIGGGPQEGYAVSVIGHLIRDGARHQKCVPSTLPPSRRRKRHRTR